MLQEKKIRSKEEIKKLQQELQDFYLYEGKIDGEEGPKTKQAENIKIQLEEKGMNEVDIEKYGYRKSMGLPAEYMLTGEYDMWDKYGDNFKQQMTSEEYQSLYK